MNTVFSDTDPADVCEKDGLETGYNFKLGSLLHHPILARGGRVSVSS